MIYNSCWSSGLSHLTWGLWTLAIVFPLHIALTGEHSDTVFQLEYTRNPQCDAERWGRGYVNIWGSSGTDQTSLSLFLSHALSLALFFWSGGNGAIWWWEGLTAYDLFAACLLLFQCIDILRRIWFGLCESPHSNCAGVGLIWADQACADRYTGSNLAALEVSTLI